MTPAQIKAKELINALLPKPIHEWRDIVAAALEASEAARVKAEQDFDKCREHLAYREVTLEICDDIQKLDDDRITALEKERDALKEALRQCISPIGGYAIKDSAQALEVVSDFLTQICRTSDIARRALESSK